MRALLCALVLAACAVETPVDPLPAMWARLSASERAELCIDRNTPDVELREFLRVTCAV